MREEKENGRVIFCLDLGSTGGTWVGRYLGSRLLARPPSRWEGPPVTQRFQQILTGPVEHLAHGAAGMRRALRPPPRPRPSAPAQCSPESWRPLGRHTGGEGLGNQSVPSPADRLWGPV